MRGREWNEKGMEITLSLSQVIRDSWSAAKRIFGDAKALKKLREEAENGANVETLRRLIQAAF